MEEKIKTLIKDVVKLNYDISLSDINLEKPPKKDLGDYAFGCFLLSRELKKNPNQISIELADLLKSQADIQFTNASGPYLNIKVANNQFSSIFIDLYTNKDKLIGNNEYNSETIVIDYIGANVGKPLHIGHMCTPNQGQTMVNLYRKLGYKVIADTHIGDWGIIFGKLITAYKLWGDRDKLQENAIDYLMELYIKITEEIEKDVSLEQTTRDEFKLLSEGNLESVALWKEFTSYSIKSVQLQLDRLNIKPDYNIGESFYEGLNFPKMEDYPDLKYTMTDIVNELIEKKIATRNEDNSVGVEFDENTKMPSCMLQKRDGTHGYFAADLAAIKYRMENWNPAKIVYFVDVRQQLHLKQAFEIAKNAGWINRDNGENTELFHAYNGFISLKDGAMSTRKGRIIRLDKLLDEAEERAKKIILEKRDDIVGEELIELSKIIGIGAIKYGYLKKSRETDVIFDWDEFMSFEGNSGPYIQYAYVRSIRILEKADIQFEKNKNDNLIFENNEETELIKLLGNYGEVIAQTAKFNMPHYLCTYAYELTKAFNSLYNTVHILNEQDETKKISRLKLIQLFSLILKDTFKLLGIDMPEKM
ncbi:MAG: arginine--tRNA ligase [Candidatus Gracilibacteria bacterium]|nr:arginine--tRNA ligase [Candidatus Gracilibacteria bacterium]